MSIDARQLRSFVVVCEEGGFGLAARKLNKTQPAVSYDIRLLEYSVGVPLFEQRRPPLLTSAGRHLLRFGQRYLAEQSQVISELREGRFPEEPVRILSVSGFGRYVLFPALREAAAAGYRYELGFPTASEVFQGVEAGRCDLGFVYLPKVSSNLTCRCIGYEELTLLAPGSWKSRRLTRPRQRDWILSQTFVTYDECDYVFGKWFQRVVGRQPQSLNRVWHFEELEEVIAMVADGRGVSILPKHAATEALHQGRVKEIRFGDRHCLNPVYSVTRSGTEPAKWLADVTASLGRRPGMHLTASV